MFLWRNENILELFDQKRALSIATYICIFTLENQMHTHIRTEWKGRNTLTNDTETECSKLLIPDISFVVHMAINTSHAEWIKMPCPFLIVSQSAYLIHIVGTNSQTEWQTVQIQSSWLLNLQKPTDLDIHSLQRQGIYRFRGTRIKHWSSVVSDKMDSFSHIQSFTT